MTKRSSASRTQHHSRTQTHNIPQEVAYSPEDCTPVSGVLELNPKRFGFLRNADKHYKPNSNDAYVSPQTIQQHKLQEGLFVEGLAAPGTNSSGPRVVSIDRIEGKPTADYFLRDWDDLTAIDPGEQIVLETPGGPLSTRMIDLFCPIGKGQRGLIVAPPRTGKTVLLSQIAEGVLANHPEMYLMVLLVDERPEEVTDMKRKIRGEVIASSSDFDAGNHVRIAQLVMERAKRLAQQGQQVFVLLDSLTRLARAYNKTAGNSGRTMSGGVDSKALEIPKRLFGTARCFEEGGSITVIGTCLVETGSRMDDVIFEEFKGTGNMELVLDRKLADRRIFPAVNLAESGTRKEERLLDPDILKRVHLLRRHLIDMPPTQAMESLLKQMEKSPSNKAFMERMIVKSPG
ncbi:MAG: transcription termination factor Rho [Zavarzinella sp.]